ncbi:hypothetical protein Tco_0512685 [Tanacetum coccineum]
MKERRYFCLMASSYKREAVIARQAWSHSECKIQAMEAQISALQRDLVRTARGLEPARDPEPQDGPADAGSSC